jgi:thiol-disulfide isomerase/thioredoxin
MRPMRIFLIATLCAVSLAGSSCAYMAALGGGVAGAGMMISMLPKQPQYGMLQDFGVTLFDGTETRISSYIGRPLVVNFWADWCPPCVGELPDFQAVYSARAGQFQLIGIAADSSKDAEGFVKQNGYDWTFCKSKEAYELYQVQGIPTTLFVDSSGRIVDKVVGGMEKAEFEAKLAEIL